MIADEEVIITISHAGYIKLPISSAYIVKVLIPILSALYAWMKPSVNRMMRKPGS